MAKAAKKTKPAAKKSVAKKSAAKKTVTKKPVAKKSKARARKATPTFEERIETARKLLVTIAAAQVVITQAGPVIEAVKHAGQMIPGLLMLERDVAKADWVNPGTAQDEIFAAVEALINQATRLKAMLEHHVVSGTVRADLPKLVRPPPPL